MAKRRRSPGKFALKTWLIRAGIGIGVGILVGFAMGAGVVKVFQPAGNVAAPDTTDASKKPRGGKTAAAEEPAADADAQERPTEGTIVPQVIGMDEGDARNLVTRTGFTVGSVTMKAGSEPLGTVVAAFPVPGEAVLLPATVNLILSDGKGKPDSTAVPPSFDR